MKYRIKFSKYDSMIYIGHLDIMRYFQKAIRRADLPIRYSEGYSPHQIMSFAAPLGVGLYSNGEYMDIELTIELNADELQTKLQAVMADGIDILSVAALPDGTKNAMASVAAAGYTVYIRHGHAPSFFFGDEFDDFMKADKLPYQKHTKKSVIELNLKERIFGYQIKKTHADSHIDNTDINCGQAIYLLLDASSGGNIKPAMVMEAYYQKMGCMPDDLDFVICREETYTRNKDGKLIPLGEVQN